MQSIKKIKNLKNKTAIVRVDFNVPISGNKVKDNFRIKKGIPTIKYLVDKGAKVLILMHLGEDGSQDTNPVIKEFFRLSKLSKKSVVFSPNIRIFGGEMDNDKDFAKEFAGLGDIYVNDAFSVSHREHASIVSIPKYLPSYMGFQLEEEIKKLSLVLNNKKHPFLFILGGAKFSTKMPLIKKYLKIADYIFVGGALANDFIKALGYEVGNSKTDENSYNLLSLLKNKKVIIPKDLLVLTKEGLKNKKINEVSKNESIIDMGKETVLEIKILIKKSKIVLWNGPVGKYEEGGDKASKDILKFLAKTKTISIVGGGDTVSMISKMKLEKDFTFVSTGGGATLDFLAKGTLPGIKVLK